MVRKIAENPVIASLVVAGALFFLMGWPTALGGGIGSYIAFRRLYAKRS